LFWEHRGRDRERERKRVLLWTKAAALACVETTNEDVCLEFRPQMRKEEVSAGTK
jgi:hypothetical protein